MAYPRLVVDLERFEDNIRYMVDDLSHCGIHVMGVNKVFNGELAPAQSLVAGGIDVVAESSLRNLANLRGLSCRKALLRSPGLSEAQATVELADVSLNSELAVIKALGEAARATGKVHQVLLMVDMGDIREGIWFENRPAILAALQQILAAPGLELYGLGTNFNCYGTVMPTRENGEAFVTLARSLEAELQITFPYLSGGNCTSYHLIDKGIMPEGINELRIGSLPQFGIEYVDVKYLAGYHHSRKPVECLSSELFLLQAEIIECNSKPTVPVGTLDKDAFMQTKSFIDRGVRRRAILNFGFQDIPGTNIQPVDERLQVLGQSSNHTLIDIQAAGDEYKLGDILAFELDYTALMFACNSPGIFKVWGKDSKAE